MHYEPAAARVRPRRPRSGRDKTSEANEAISNPSARPMIDRLRRAAAGGDTPDLFAPVRPGRRCLGGKRRENRGLTHCLAEVPGAGRGVQLDEARRQADEDD